MKKNLIILIILPITLIFFSYQSLNNKINLDSISGIWKGKYSWFCLEQGSQEITFKIVDNKGIISGTANLLGIEYKIKGYRLTGAKLGEWRYLGGNVSPNGKNIIIDIVNNENSKIAKNTFSGELKKGIIVGITQNGEKCSTYKGPSGKFSLSK